MGYHICAWAEIRVLGVSISRNVSQRVQLTVLFIWSGQTVCASCLYEGFVIYYYPPSLMKRKNSVGSVGSVGKSEKSPEKIL